MDTSKQGVRLIKWMLHVCINRGANKVQAETRHQWLLIRSTCVAACRRHRIDHSYSCTYAYLLLTPLRTAQSAEHYRQQQ
jgi:hypothetical protein